MYGKRNISPEEREALSEKAKKGAQMVAEKVKWQKSYRKGNTECCQLYNG